MSFPSDVKLPASAKYFGFVDDKKQYNPNYDIIWSFEYALSGDEGAFATFLTSTIPSTSAIPGHYLCYSGTIPISAYITDENGDFILTEDNDRLILEGNSGIETPYGLSIGFDTTGLFALSGNNRPGVGLSNIKRNSLIIRDDSDNLVLYEELSNINPSFEISNSEKIYKTLRFKYTNTKTLSIDFKTSKNSDYIPLTSVDVTIDPNNYQYFYTGLSYTSPVSSLNDPSVLFLKNFHIQGSELSTSEEVITFNKLS